MNQSPTRWIIGSTCAVLIVITFVWYIGRPASHPLAISWIHDDDQRATEWEDVAPSRWLLRRMDSFFHIATKCRLHSMS